MTTLVEALLVDRLIQQVERRTRAEAEASDNARSLTISEGRAVDFQRERDQAKEAYDIVSRALVEREKARDEMESALRLLSVHAERVAKVLADRRNTHPVEAARCGLQNVLNRVRGLIEVPF